MTINIQRPKAAKPFRGVTMDQARAARPANLIVKDCWDCDDIPGVVSTEAGVIEILDEIGGWGVYAAEVIPALRAMDGEGKTILIRISSYGGDVFEGLAIANTIADLKATTIVEVISVAASIASIIACAADKVRIRKSAQMMIHRPWAWTWGEASDLRSAADHLDMIEGQLIDVYADRSAGKKSREEFAAAVAKETWMTGAISVEWGIADEVIDTAAAAAPVLDKETMEASGIRNAPVELVAPVNVAEDEAPAADEALSADTETDAPSADAAPVEADPAPDAETDAPAPAENASEKNSPLDATQNQGRVNIQAYDEISSAAIRTAFARANRPELAEEAMATGLSVEQAKAKAFDLLAEQDTKAPATAILGGEGTAADAKGPSAFELLAQIRERQFAALNKKNR
jgi:ATP-dependent protease ClpP protease subunit